MNAGERRYVDSSWPGCASPIYRLTFKLFRYDVMLSRRLPVYNAVLANEQIRYAILEERLRKEVRVKGRSILVNTLVRVHILILC